MKRFKVIFINKSKLVLHVECKMSGSPDLDRFMVLNRKTLRLLPAQYEITTYYEGRTVLIQSKSIDNKGITEVPAPDHSKFTAKKTFLNLPEQNVRIIFREQISVGSIIDGSANRGF